MACSYNPETGERRDSCHLGQETLAHDLGVGDRKTIRRRRRRLEVFDFVRRIPGPGGAKSTRARFGPRTGT
jgi:hypothetical protein